MHDEVVSTLCPRMHMWVKPVATGSASNNRYPRPLLRLQTGRSRRTISSASVCLHMQFLPMFGPYTRKRFKQPADMQYPLPGRMSAILLSANNLIDADVLPVT